MKRSLVENLKSMVATSRMHLKAATMKVWHSLPNVKLQLVITYVAGMMLFGLLVSNTVMLHKALKTIHQQASQHQSLKKSVLKQTDGNAVASKLTALQDALSIQQNNTAKWRLNVSQTLTVLSKHLDTQLSALQATIYQVKQPHKADNTKSQSKPSLTLPFTVIGLDYWNGLAKVTIQYQDQYALLGLYDRRWGWRLTNINPKTGLVTFENPQGAQVTKSLPVGAS